MPEVETGLRIDLGCGSNKKEGTIGIDIHPSPVTDYVLDVEKESLPFADQSVSYVHSSHFLEHTHDIGRIFGEISRVCVDGARVELWTPYAWSNDGVILGHQTFFTEDVYLHMCVWYVDAWKAIINARWVLNELQYVVSPYTLSYLKANNISLDFALKHLHNISTEFCAHITVLHSDQDLSHPPVRRTFSTGRFAPRYKVKLDPSSRPIEARTEMASDAEVISVFADGQALPTL